jgi:transmembrane sensor
MNADPSETREEIEQIAATWIARRSEASWIEADTASFNVWLAESVGHRAAYYRLNRIWTQVGSLESPGVTVRAGRRYRHFALAASVLLLFVGALVAVREGLLDLTSGRSEVQHSLAQVRVAPKADTAVAPKANTAVALQGGTTGGSGASLPAQSFHRRFNTAVGAARTFSLPDGSHLTLDTDTQVRVSMDGRSRVVEFDRGQVYIQVAHDSRRAFVVNAGQLSVIAVGTEFSVRGEGSDFRVVVAAGVVRLERHTGDEAPAVARPDDVLLRAGGIARVESDAIQVRQGQASEVEGNLSWRDGVLTFRHASLAEAAAEFNRYNTRKLVIADFTVADLDLGGVFQSSDVEAFVRLLERTFPIDAAVRTDRIELSARKSP